MGGHLSNKDITKSNLCASCDKNVIGGSFTVVIVSVNNI